MLLVLIMATSGCATYNQALCRCTPAFSAVFRYDRIRKHLSNFAMYKYILCILYIIPSTYTNLKYILQIVIISRMDWIDNLYFDKYLPFLF